MADFLKTKQFSVLLHVIIWGSLILLPLLINYAGATTHTEPERVAHFFYTISSVVNMMAFYFNAYWLYPVLIGRGRWFLYIVSLAGLIFASYFLKALIAGIWVKHYRIEDMMRPAAFFSTMVCLLISIIYRLALDNRRRERLQKEKLAQQQATELKFLRSQINPHFLFNVLNNMVSLARQKSDQLEPSLIMLSGIMRYMLYESNGDKVTVRKEVEYLQNYIALQRLRFEEQVTIDTQISINGANGSIEPMLLIAFVENAFKHGTGLVEDPFIRVTLTVQHDVLQLVVVNKFNEHAMESKDSTTGIGLSNVRSRLELLYPGKHSVLFNKSNGLFQVTLTLHLS